MGHYISIYPSVTTVIGYTYNADTYCPPCAQSDQRFDVDDMDTTGAIFNGSEWDYVPVCGACGETIDGVTVLDVDQEESDIFDCADCGEAVWPYQIGCPACGSLTPLYGTPKKVERWTCYLCGTSDHESESDAESCCGPCCENHCDHCGECDCGIDHDPDSYDAHDMECQCGDCLTNRIDVADDNCGVCREDAAESHPHDCRCRYCHVNRTDVG